MLFYDHHSDQDIIMFVMVIMAMIIITCDQHHRNCRRHHHLYLYLPVCLEPTGRFASGECSQVQALLQTGQQTNLVTMMMIIMMTIIRVKDDDGHISKLLGIETDDVDSGVGDDVDYGVDVDSQVLI